MLGIPSSEASISHQIFLFLIAELILAQAACHQFIQRSRDNVVHICYAEVLSVISPSVASLVSRSARAALPPREPVMDGFAAGAAP